VYFDRETFEHKKMPMLEEEAVKEAFGNSQIRVFTDKKLLENFLLSYNWKGTNLLLMSSGNFSGMNIDELSTKILNR
jgi:UDP-N-acetylmuramate: L-alanyl-gamma-D-glutamyl-meso-diaminopimelate ligase